MRCVYSLSVQYAMRMRRVIMSCLAEPYFPTLPHKRHDLKKKILNIKCVLISLQLLSDKFLILRRIQRDIITNVLKFPRKTPAIPVAFQWNFNFLDKFSKNTQISNLILQWEGSYSTQTGDRWIQRSLPSLFEILATRLKMTCGFRSSGIWRRVGRRVLPDVSKVPCAFIINRLEMLHPRYG